MWNRWRPRLSLALILALAAVLRLWGLRWGLPNELHSYSYHPDEFLTIGAAGAVLTGFFPRFYNYPSLYIYLAATAIFLGSAYGLTPNIADAYLCARVVTVLMGIATVAATYWAGRQLFDGPHPDRPGYVIPDGGSPGHAVPTAPAVGLIAALILCIAPLHVQHSHFATVDVPSTLFIASCLGFAGLVLIRGSWRDYLMCGLMAGLAAGTKYNAGMVILALVAAHLLHARGQHPELVEGRSRAVKLAAALGCAVLAFIVSTPAVIFRWSNFWYGFTYELKHAATGHGLTFVGTGNGFLFTFTSSLWYGLGPALAILFVIAAIYGIVRLDRSALVILAFTIPYYALISLSQVRFARYSLPLFPPAALLIAWTAVDLYQRLSIVPVREGGLRSMLPRIHSKALAVVLTLSLAGTLLYAIALDRLFVQPPPQDRAARWVFANIPKGSSIGVFEVPWFYSPPYSATTGLGTLRQRLQALEGSPYSVLPLGYRHWSWPASRLPGWCVISDFEVSDAQRLGNLNSHELRARLSNQEIGDTCRIISVELLVKQIYLLRRTFSTTLEVMDISFGSTQSLPHDMRYPAPTIWVYMANPHVKGWAYHRCK